MVRKNAPITNFSFTLKVKEATETKAVMPTEAAGKGSPHRADPNKNKSSDDKRTNQIWFYRNNQTVIELTKLLGQYNQTVIEFPNLKRREYQAVMPTSSALSLGFKSRS